MTYPITVIVVCSVTDLTTRLGSFRSCVIQDQVRQLEQAADIRARVVAGHGTISVAKKSFSVFG